ncbi:DUF2958 domain-containing protein [Mesorhizobium sp. VK22B]|uniref:DUF2958 domain-containing protein n=1 Tax=Mesorhizobium captivum TaxID=3072319 RepID=A0ABU4YZT8_9HYPH|nr:MULTISPECIES: DUF2958 domain-containing protein [unclassified Mesorhizobium]MDX8492492.1 DUF2958 domain-containing protein [Mesorhizobium sp. VK22B]MDX8505581.1 DUF2958 domain-containing protein [Mesorhizobium sp. VK22E]
MILLTPELRERLLANGRNRDADHVPVVRFFNPVGAATWLATELHEDGDTLFGLADLGFGCPELGSFSLLELQAVRLALGLGIERDLLFAGHFPISAYAGAARVAGSIPEGERVLRAAAGGV